MRPRGSPLTLTGDTIVTPGPMPSPCLVWKWNKNWKGYGRVKYKGTKIVAHRAFYLHFCCAIPEGLTLDHLCRNKACVNWEHLEPVTMKVNLLRGNAVSALNARKTHCLRGHEFAEKSPGTIRNRRICRVCIRLNEQKRRAKRRAEA